MLKENKKVIRPYTNVFKQTAHEHLEVAKYTVTRAEFENLLGDEYAIVAIRRDENSEFLFKDQPEFLVGEDTKYAILNLQFGLDNMSFVNRLTGNDRYVDTLEIIE